MTVCGAIRRGAAGPADRIDEEAGIPGGLPPCDRALAGWMPGKSSMAVVTVFFQRLALKEHHAGRQWDARQGVAASGRFQDQVDKAVERIAASPDRWSTGSGDRGRAASEAMTLAQPDPGH